MTETIHIIRITTDSAMLILIWLVQLIIYPSFHLIEPDLFRAWHRRYMNTISIFVIPVMLLQALCILLQLSEGADAFSIGAAIAVLAAWLVTFGLSAPCHRILQHEGRERDVISRLISTNWIRTACWSLVWLLDLAGRQA